MQLPLPLRTALEHEAERFPLSELVRAHARLSEGYRSGIPLGRLSSAELVAYAVARMPATYAAASAVLRLVMERITASEPPMKLATLLDLGAGLGSVLWAVAENVPSIGKARLIDSSSGMIQFGKALARSGPSALIQHAEWIAADVRGMSFDPHDLVVCSYSLGELPFSTAAAALHGAWKAAQEVLVIIEPGTPAGFARIREWRHQLIALGAHVVAPCPHALSSQCTKLTGVTSHSGSSGLPCTANSRVDRWGTRTRSFLTLRSARFLSRYLQRASCAIRKSRRAPSSSNYAPLLN
jgi:ribosomal protein RSM22 (predicted rRNA methylase)